MAGKQRERDVAESGLTDSPFGGLQAILDRYDDRRAELERNAPNEVMDVEERERFALDYSAWREHRLRAMLEEIAWLLEQRGHHAWIEDVGAEDIPAQLVSVREKHAVVRPIDLCLVPGPGDLDESAAARLRVVPDGDARRVRIEAAFGEPADAEPVPVTIPLPLDEVTDRLVVDTATDFVREALFRGEPVAFADPYRESDPPDEDASSLEGGDIEPDLERAWSDSGITKRWLAQQRLARRTH